MKHHMKRQLRRLSTQRPYQMIVGSAAVLVLATGAAALAAGVDDAPTDQRRTAESAPRLDDVASRAQARVAAPAPASPSASPSATPTASPAASPTQSPRITRAKVRATVDPDLTRKAAPKPKR